MPRSWNPLNGGAYLSTGALSTNPQRSSQQQALQIASPDENGPVGFHAASKVFAARDVFDGRPIGAEYLQLVVAIPTEMRSTALEMKQAKSFWNRNCRRHRKR